MSPRITGHGGTILLSAALLMAAGTGYGQRDDGVRFWASAERVEVTTGNARPETIVPMGPRPVMH